MPTKKAAAKKTAAKKSESSPSSSKETLQDIMVDMLKDIYWAENHLAKALPKLAKAAEHPKLKAAFEKHTIETKDQIEQLKTVFSLLGQAPRGIKCDAMEGLVKEGQSAIEDHDASAARDAALIAESQKAEHYEISTYGSLQSMATVLGIPKAAKVFANIKKQEIATDEALTKLAEVINPAAAQ